MEIKDIERRKLAQVLDRIEDWDSVGVILSSYSGTDVREGKHIVYTVTRRFFGFTVDIWKYGEPDLVVYMPLSEYNALWFAIKNHARYRKQEKKRKAEKLERELEARRKKSRVELWEKVLNDETEND